jgi:thiol-disulfide isomerase/thioredoxin
VSEDELADLIATLYVSSFCGACARTREVLGLVAPLVGERVEWREVNVASDPGESEQRRIVATPTVVFTDPRGTERVRASGVPTPDQVLAAIAGQLPENRRD